MNEVAARPITSSLRRAAKVPPRAEDDPGRLPVKAYLVNLTCEGEYRRSDIPPLHCPLGLSQYGNVDPMGNRI